VNAWRDIGTPIVMTGSEDICQLSVVADRLPSALLAQGQRLQEAVAQHKAAMRRHREQLQLAKSALVRLEAQCRELGIQLIVQE
jgi:hypothetical protein